MLANELCIEKSILPEADFGCFNTVSVSAAAEGRLTFDALEVDVRGVTLAQTTPSSIVARDGV